MSSLTPGRYAAVAATLALAVSVGGTSYAALSIGTKDLKSNAVTSPKIAKNAVKSADVKDDGLTGADVDESTLGKVPTAGTADSAASATTATTATTAGALAGGARIVLVNHRSGDVTDAPIGSLNGLTLRVTCTGGIETLNVLNGSSSIGEISAVSGDGSDTSDPTANFNDSFNPGQVFTLGFGASPSDRIYTIIWSAGDGKNVTIHAVTEDTIGSTGCNVSGYLVG